MGLQESIKKVLREETKLPLFIRRRFSKEDIDELISNVKFSIPLYGDDTNINDVVYDEVREFMMDKSDFGNGTLRNSLTDSEYFTQLSKFEEPLRDYVISVILNTNLQESIRRISREDKKMKIKSIKVIKGKNKWSESKTKLIHMVLDLGEFEQKPSNKIDGFYERIKKHLPSLKSHRCSIGKPGGFFQRIKKGTWMGHIIEHVALELQTLAGYDTGWGRTRGVKGEKGVYNVVFNYENEECGKLAAKEAFNVVNDIINNKDPKIDQIIKKLKPKTLKESIRRILREDTEMFDFIFDPKSNKVIGFNLTYNSEEFDNIRYDKKGEDRGYGFGPQEDNFGNPIKFDSLEDAQKWYSDKTEKHLQKQTQNPKYSDLSYIANNLRKIDSLDYEVINRGSCFRFAKEISKLGYNKFTFIFSEEEQEVIHVYVKLTNNLYFDANGFHTKKEIKNEYYVGEDTEMYDSDIDELDNFSDLDTYECLTTIPIPNDVWKKVIQVIKQSKMSLQESIRKVLREEVNKPSESEFIQAIKDVKSVIPLISHRIIEEEDLEHNEENMVRLNKKILQKVIEGDNEILDEMWELAGSRVIKHAINIITYYTI